MATEFGKRGTARRNPSIAPNRFEILLALLAAAMLAAVLLSLAKGASEWGSLPTLVWFHLATVGLALGLSPVILLRRRGDRWHRITGYVWAAAILTPAAATFGIRDINEGGLSPIHFLSAFTLVMVPTVVLAARSHNIAAHRRGVQAAVGGALLIAGFFTFLPDRLLGAWLLG